MTRFSPEACIALLAFLFLAACDRPLVDPIAPEIEVVSPELDVVQTEQRVTLQLSVGALSGVDEVRVDNIPATFDDETGLWELSVRLVPGANSFVIEAVSDDATATREIDIVQASIEVRIVGGVLPEGLAGHTATALSGGVLLTGGIGESGGVLGTARILRETGGLAFSVGGTVALQSPRTGHTATALPDGRVLLLGGTSAPEASGAADFVADPEIYDPETGSTRPVFTRRSRSLRTGHTTVLLTRDGRTYLYALGGRAPTGNAGAPVATSGTVDVLELKSTAFADTLVTLTPGGGAGGGVRPADAAQLIVSTSANQVVTVVTGFDGSAVSLPPFAERFFYTAPGTQYPFDISIGGADLPLEPRTAADGAGFGNALALLVGGRDASGSPLASMEVFSDRLARFLSVPASLVRARYSHTVTRAPSGRILVIGGRDASGQALSSVEVLTL